MTREQVAVVGLGFLGRGIAASLLSHGYRVIGYARSAESLAKAGQSIRLAIDELVEHGYGDPSLRTDWPARFLGTSSFDDLAPCGFVIESVAEDIEVKGDVFDEIERVVGADVPVASNTSAIPISTMQRSRLRPERFLGMHWAEPAHATRFLELIRGEFTGEAAFERAVALADPRWPQAAQRMRAAGRRARRDASGRSGVFRSAGRLLGTSLGEPSELSDARAERSAVFR